MPRAAATSQTWDAGGGRVQRKHNEADCAHYSSGTFSASSAGAINGGVECLGPVTSECNWQFLVAIRAEQLKLLKSKKQRPQESERAQAFAPLVGHSNEGKALIIIHPVPDATHRTLTSGPSNAFECHQVHRCSEHTKPSWAPIWSNKFPILNSNFGVDRDGRWAMLVRCREKSSLTQQLQEEEAHFFCSNCCQLCAD